MASRIRRGDKVQVMTGKDKGKTGVVTRVLPDKDRVLVRGANIVKRHLKPNQKNPQGGIADREASVHVSNVQLVDPQDNRPCKIKFESRDGRSIRVSKRTGAEVPEVLELPEQ